MANIIIPICSAVVFPLMAFVMLRIPALKEEKSIKALKISNRKDALFVVGMVLVVFTVAAFLIFLYHADWIFSMKRLFLCAILWPLAYIDIQKHIIPNKILIVALVVRAVLVIPEVIFQSETLRTQLLGDALACVGIAVILCLMRLVVKNGIGFGDIKLFAVIGLFFGIAGSITTIFLSFVFSFLVSLILLISKRKSKHDQIAFAPFILAGLVAAVVFFGA